MISVFHSEKQSEVTSEVACNESPPICKIEGPFLFLKVFCNEYKRCHSDILTTPHTASPSNKLWWMCLTNCCCFFTKATVIQVQKKKAGAFISHLVWEWLYSEVSACKTRAELVKKSTADRSGWMWKLNYYFCNHSFQNFVILVQKILIALLLNITCGGGFLLKWARWKNWRWHEQKGLMM